jgi:hypothetical protein
MLADRREELTRARMQTVNRLQRLDACAVRGRGSVARPRHPVGRGGVTRIRSLPCRFSDAR